MLDGKGMPSTGFSAPVTGQNYDAEKYTFLSRNVLSRVT